MLMTYIKSKIHRVKITHTDLNYEGSIEIDSDLMEAANINKYEQVHVLNLSNANRFVTYAIPAPAGSGKIGLAGPAARLGSINDLVIIITYAQLNEEEAADHKPTVVQIKDHNKIKEIT